jgi:hypothetical protein
MIRSGAVMRRREAVCESEASVKSEQNTEDFCSTIQMTELG